MRRSIQRVSAWAHGRTRGARERAGRRATRPTSWLRASWRVLVLGCGLWLWAARPAAAQRTEAWALRGRAMLGAATMISHDQAGRLGYSSIGLVSDLQLGYVLFPWLDVQLGMAGGGFSAGQHTGGLLAPVAGVTAQLPWESLMPYALVQAGPGFSGKLARPFFRAGAGVDFRMTRAIGFGPVFGYGQLFQTDGQGYSTDARFLWLGLSLSFRPAPAPPPRVREEVRVRHIWQEQTPPEPPGPPHEPPPPSEELLDLIEQTLPVERRELLAPVLFAFDSAELDPSGIAMLHEVVHALEEHPEIELVEVRAYADSRGSDEYNQALSARRADAVVAWLCAHGIAPERLQSAPLGEADPVEPKEDEASYQQNRRVVFRILRMRQQP